MFSHMYICMRIHKSPSNLLTYVVYTYFDSKNCKLSIANI